MKLLIFDVKGKFAHFRKFYTNSSSLTYSFPPRTTICGLVASILGYERDSYYSLFSRKEAHIGIRLMGRNRKIMQTLNYMKIETTAQFCTPKDHTQIPFEVLTADDGVTFRIYFSHENQDIFNDLERRVKQGKFFYMPYLGAAPFNCSIKVVEFESAKTMNSLEEVAISSVVNMDSIIPKSLKLTEQDIRLSREKMPVAFLENRIVEQVKPYIFEESGQALSMKLQSEFVNITYKSCEKENIIFM